MRGSQRRAEVRDAESRRLAIASQQRFEEFAARNSVDPEGLQGPIERAIECAIVGGALVVRASAALIK